MLLQWQQEHTLKNQDATSLSLLPYSLLVQEILFPCSWVHSHLILLLFPVLFSCLDDSLSAANTNLSLAVPSLPAFSFKDARDTRYWPWLWAWCQTAPHPTTPACSWQQKTMVEIKAPGWQKQDYELVQKKLNWNLAEWESNQNSKGFVVFGLSSFFFFFA